MRWGCCVLVSIALFDCIVSSTPIEVERSHELNPDVAETAEGGAYGELIDDEDRDKRATLEAKKQLKFGFKNKILDLIFGKINQAIDFKTGLVTQLDKLNIEKNRQLLKTVCDTHGSAHGSFGGYPAAGASIGASAGISAGGGATANPLGTTTDDIVEFDRNRVMLDLPGELFGSSVNLITKGSQIVGDVIMANPLGTTTDDIVEFDRNRVMLDLPGELFGSSVNLITKGSQIVGDVIMNSAVRFQRLVEAVKPFFGNKLGITATRSKREADHQ